jgi:hypothetical protein
MQVWCARTRANYQPRVNRINLLVRTSGGLIGGVQAGVNSR